MDHRSEAGPERYLRGMALPVKDALRGVRYGLQSFRDAAVSLQSRLPGPLNTLGAAAIDRLDRVATEVDRNTSLVVHRYLDPLIARDAETAAFSNLIAHPNAPLLFARIGYDNLKPLIAYICKNYDHEESFFISEMLAAIAWQRAAAAMDETNDDTKKAALLLVSMSATGVVRTTTSANAARSSVDVTHKIARVAGFALIVWLLIERNCTPEDEEALLFTCCDLALALGEMIDAAGDDAALLSDLIESYAAKV